MRQEMILKSLCVFILLKRVLTRVLKCLKKVNWKSKALKLAQFNFHEYLYSLVSMGFRS